MVSVATGSCVFALVMTGYGGTLLKITMSTGALMMLAVFVAVRTYGITGAATAIALGIAVRNGLMLWIVKKRWEFGRI